MKAIVDQDACIGCGLCVDTCPVVFSMEEYSAVGGDIPDDDEAREKVGDAVEDCPTSAIFVED